MGIFNLRILDASIRDVVVHLSDTQKADVLLHALQYLPIQGCRIVMENAVQSLLQVPNLPSQSANVAHALLLGGKDGLVAGYHTPGQQDLQSALMVDPENQDVKATIQSQHPCPEMLRREPDPLPHFPEEVWRQVGLFLPRRDLRSMLLVPNGLSRIASQLLFREIDLHLTTAVKPSGAETTPEEIVDRELDAWHDKRSADILMRILNDSRFANRVRSLSIFAVSSDGTPPLAFKVGMLMHVLPKLLNIRKVHCSGNKELISSILQVVRLHNPRLQQLSIVATEDAVDIDVPVFKHITHLAISSRGESTSSIHTSLSQTRDTLCCLAINNPHWRFPAQLISVRRLTQIQFEGCLSREAFSDILANGHQLESLVLSGVLRHTASSSFRKYSTALSLLRHFSLAITGVHRAVEDRDLCLAISDFLWARTQLQTYCFFVSSAVAQRIGFDASAWGVLPALSKLSGLSITYPKDLPPGLAGWLVPRTVRALTLDLPSAMDRNFMNQLRAGMPPLLRYVGITGIPSGSVMNVVENGFPNVSVARINRTIWTVTRSGEDGTLEVEQWPVRRAEYHVVEWLESLGCVDAIWEGVDGPRYI